jgi:hypothetical protein
MRVDARERVSASARDGNKFGFGGFSSLRYHRAARVEFGAHVSANGRCDGYGVSQMSGQNGVIGFAEIAELNGALQAGSGFFRLREYQYSAGFAVEAERHAENVRP